MLPKEGLETTPAISLNICCRSIRSIPCYLSYHRMITGPLAFFQLTNNRRSDFCQPSPTTSHYTAADPADMAAVGSVLPTAVVALIGALAFVLAAILASLGAHRLWKRRSAALSASPAVSGWLNFYLRRNTQVNGS